MMHLMSPHALLRGTVLLLLGAAVMLVLAACGEEEPTATPPALPAAPGPATHIVIASNTSTNNFWLFGDRDTDQSGLVAAGLVSQSVLTQELYPVLAEEIPTVENGLWVINADGTMTTTYKLREGLTWHDGTALTSDDFVFGWEVAGDDNVPVRDRITPKLISSIDTPDDRTIVIHWKQEFNRANRIQKQDLRQLPRHIIGEAYEQAKSSGNYQPFENLRFWNREWVGTGPYRLVDYGDGTQWKLEAFDNYALGRPQIDKITLKVVEDSNAALTGFLAGELDATWGSLDMQGALVLKDTWEPEGKGTVTVSPISSRQMAASLNPWFDDIRVRRGLFHAMNRDSINQTAWGGLSRLMHFPMNPFEPRFDRALAAATIYEFDPAKAKDLLAQAGWTPGPDGVLVNAQGERFEFEFRVQSGRADMEQSQAIIIDNWKDIGVIAKPANLPRRIARAEENRARWPGVGQMTGNVNVWEWIEKWTIDTIPSEENRWTGGNESRWVNQRADEIVHELETILTQQEEDDLVIEFIKLWTEDLPTWPLAYSVDVFAVSNRLTGPTIRSFSGGNGMKSWNIHEWQVVE